MTDLFAKKIYLLQSLGTDLGYSYNWYVRGPYSPALTNYIYTNLDVLASGDFSNYRLSENAEVNIGRVNGLLKEKRQDFKEASWYELLASLLYIHNNSKSWKLNGEDATLFATLMRYKPQYNVEQCEYAFNVLRDKGFVKAGASYG